MSSGLALGVRLDQQNGADVQPTPTAAVSILRYQDLRAAISFLERAFGLELIVAVEDSDVIVHAQLRAGLSRVFLSPDQPGDVYGMRTPLALAGTNQCVYLVIGSDVDAHAAHAEAVGAVIVAAPHDTDYGGREYSCRDFEGHIWSVGTYMGE